MQENKKHVTETRTHSYSHKDYTVLKPWALEFSLAQTLGSQGLEPWPTIINADLNKFSYVCEQF